MVRGGCWECACVEGIFDYRTGEVPVLLHASARRAASSNGVSSSGNSFRIRSSRAIVGLRSPSTSGRATDALTGVTRFSQSEERYGVSTGTSTISRLPAEQGSDPLDHLPVGHHLRPARVVALAVRGFVAADARQVAGDVVERDRLRRRRDPARRHHDRQPLDQAEDRLEGGAPLADDHGRTQGRHRDARGGEPLSGLAAAAQVRRRVGVVGAEPAEVDDLPHACVRRLARDRLRRRAILLLEVAAPSGVDEVVDDVRTFQGRGDAISARRVGDQPAGAGLVTRGARDRGQLVLGQQGHERPSDDAGCAEDGDVHESRLRSRSSK